MFVRLRRDSLLLSVRVLTRLQAFSTKADAEIDHVYPKIIYNSQLVKIASSRLTPEENRKYGSKAKMDWLIRGKFLHEKEENCDAICLKYLQETEEPQEIIAEEKNKTVHFPYEKKLDVAINPVEGLEEDFEDCGWLKRPEKLLKRMVRDKNWLPHAPELADDNVEKGDPSQSKMFYGTVDPNVPVSDVPCGGCGALLHCQDTSIPGFLPKELFHGLSNNELKTMVCQRCHFLKDYNIALRVNVSPEDYPKILAPVKYEKSLVLLMVDVLDMPCSMWPGIMDIIGRKRPVVVVANKVDLLVHDSLELLHHIRESLMECLVEAGIPPKNIKYLALVSAKTGFGLEELITKIMSRWGYQGDIYIIGCTNVGKSSLFNSLIMSDMCKVQAVDLMHRATVSEWPGTTLNLLRFPILRPTEWRLYIRRERMLEKTKKRVAMENQREEWLKKTLFRRQTTLKEEVGRSFLPEHFNVHNVDDPFSVAISSNRSVVPLGLNPNSPIYRDSKWCYDTPGVVHPDQILNILTTEEIQLTLPKNLVMPRVVHLRPGHSIFIAGLARLDLLRGPEFVWLSVFASHTLPLTITKIEDADEVYNELLGTDILKVPMGNEDRLKKWPQLVDKELEITGKYKDEVAAEVVLSSAGWVGVTMEPAEYCTLRAWTPEARGIHVRPPFLRKAHKLRGFRIRGTPVYKSELYHHHPENLE